MQHQQKMLLLAGVGGGVVASVVRALDLVMHPVQGLSFLEAAYGVCTE